MIFVQKKNFLRNFELGLPNFPSLLYSFFRVVEFSRDAKLLFCNQDPSQLIARQERVQRWVRGKFRQPG